MRLNRLQLIRYGRFENAEIVFPRPACDAARRNHRLRAERSR